MKWSKIVLAGIVVGILKGAWGWLTCGWLFSWVYKLEPVSVWKLPEEMQLGMMNLVTIIAAMLFAFVYGVVNKGLPGKSLAVKGLMLGLLIWLASTLPGIFSMKLYMVVAPTVIYYWIIMDFIVSLWAGALTAVIYGKN